MKLGQKIRMLRAVKGYSQEVMAEALKLSITGYGKIERGETDITVSRLQQIAEVLDIKAEDILRFDSTMPLPFLSSAAVGKPIEVDKTQMNRLEEEMTEMRELLRALLKDKTAN